MNVLHLVQKAVCVHFHLGGCMFFGDVDVVLCYVVNPRFEK